MMFTNDERASYACELAYGRASCFCAAIQATEVLCRKFRREREEDGRECACPFTRRPRLPSAAVWHVRRRSESASEHIRLHVVPTCHHSTASQPVRPISLAEFLKFDGIRQYPSNQYWLSCIAAPKLDITTPQMSSVIAQSTTQCTVEGKEVGTTPSGKPLCWRQLRYTIRGMLILV